MDPAALLVATFDHATGPFATAAVDTVAAAAERYGLRFVTARLRIAPDDGRRRTSGGQEAAWRRARWDFLRGVASTAEPGAVVATAHTRDDQIETVFMRVLRDAGPRGLAALYAPSPILRPLLALDRAEIERYALERRVTFVTDPSNTERTYLRNRIRHDLLPAILGQRPGFAEELLALSRRAAEWRARMDAIAATFTVMTDATGSYHIPRAQLAGLPTDALRVVWPALAARGGVVMDWRGTHRLATFTIEGEPGQSIQLSGGFEVVMRRESMVLRRWRRHG
jgi:tRNA(Ile)-lysidine synthase